MIKNLQLVALGVVVLQAVGMNASENKATNSPRSRLSLSAEIAKRSTVKHQIEMNKIEKGTKRQCFNVSVPSYIVLERRDWHAELQKNPDLAWLPI
jgi:hypothetical protein